MYISNVEIEKTKTQVKINQSIRIYHIDNDSDSDRGYIENCH